MARCEIGKQFQCRERRRRGGRIECLFECEGEVGANMNIGVEGKKKYLPNTFDISVTSAMCKKYQLFCMLTKGGGNHRCLLVCL